MKEQNKNYLWNLGLVGVNAIAKAVDVYLTYKGMELDENFVEHNPIMRKIIHNKPLTYLASAGYVGGLAGMTYIAHKSANHFEYEDLDKIGTIGLGLNIIGNLAIIGNNLIALRNLRNRMNYIKISNEFYQVR